MRQSSSGPADLNTIENDSAIAIDKSDHLMSAEQLREKYVGAGFGGWGGHPRHPRADWQYEAGQGDTQIGYWDWVVSRLEQEALEDPGAIYNRLKAHLGDIPDAARTQFLAARFGLDNSRDILASMRIFIGGEQQTEKFNGYLADRMTAALEKGERFVIEDEGAYLDVLRTFVAERQMTENFDIFLARQLLMALDAAAERSGQAPSI
jgi:hypothetical protein